VRGSQRDSYTAGIICEKVQRYAERAHHPDRLNALTSAEPGWPNGGAVFHDTAVWIRRI
jgi:hypothetical protein